MKKHVSILFLLLFSISVQAAKVEEITTYSKVMNKEIPAMVIMPDSYSNGGNFPVVYLLHGHGNTYKTGWGREDVFIKKFADRYDIIIVLPDGGRNSWYFDSPIDPSIRYETYICTELIPHIDKNYSTIAEKRGRGITGLSMGGHGALYLSFRNSHLFGVAGSSSGGVDIRPWPQAWELPEKLGDYATHPQNWEENTVINLTHLLTPKTLSLIIDCGTEDFFYPVNEALHQKLLYYNIPHEYITRPGKHNWSYWRNSIEYQLLYMSNFFSAQNK